MRPLTNIRSIEAFHGAEKRVYLTMPGSVHTFTQDQIVSLGSLVWEAEFMGGLSLPGAPQPVLAMSLGYQKELRAAGLVGAELAVEVSVGGNTIRPYVGIVRGYEPLDTTRLQLSVVDRTTDTDPLIPAATITDSFPTPHLEHLTDGQHAFYGNVSSRNIYFAAVTSDAGLFLGPTNVASATHASISGSLDAGGVSLVSLYLGENSNFILQFSGAGWQQQCGGQNLLLCNCGGTVYWPNIQISQPQVDYSLLVEIDGIDQNSFFIQNAGFRVFPVPANVSSRATVDVTFTRDILIAKTIRAQVTNHGIISNSTQLYITSLFIGDAGGIIGSAIDQFSGAVYLDISTFNYGPGKNGKFGITWSGSSATARQGLFVQFAVGLPSERYRRNSVFAPVNATGIAISTNPLAVLDHVNSFQAQIPYRQDQSSAMQALVGSYQFNGYVGPERQAFTEFVDEIGRLTGTTFWAGDSGTLNMKTYALSAVAQNSVNFIIPADLMESFKLTETPLGSTRFESEKANKITVRYDYVHHTNDYRQSLRAVYSLGGVTKEKEVTSPYIIDTLTASLYANNLRLKYATGKEIATIGLPLQFLGVELADVLRLQHPLIVGSEGFYQVKRVELDLDNWALSVDAVRLVS